MGTPASLYIHLGFFLISFAIAPFLNFDRVINVFTNILSVEAILLAIFIQMSVNKQHKKLSNIEDDIDDILEDTESLTEDQKQEIKEKLKKRK